MSGSNSFPRGNTVHLDTSCSEASGSPNIAPNSLSASDLKTLGLFHSLTNNDRESVLSLAEPLRRPAGSILLKKGESDRDLYLVLSGTLVPFLTGKNGLDEVVLGTIGPGSIIGEFAFLDAAPRSASVRVTSDCEVLRLPYGALRALPDGDRIIGDMKGALASQVVQRTRNTNEAVVAGLEKELEHQQRQNEFGHFLIYTISIFLVAMVLFYVVAEDVVEDVYEARFAWQGLLMLALPSLITIRLLNIPLDQLGIRKKGLWRSLREASLICLGLTLVAGLVIFFLPTFGPQGEDTAAAEGATVDTWFLFHYFFHSIFQELGARGLIQGLFRRFLDDRTGHRSVFLTSVVFSVLHLAFGLDAVLVTFFGSLAFGYFYLRSGNLAGVSLLHYYLGCAASIMVLL